MQSQAVFPTILSSRSNKIANEVLVVLGGIAFLSLFAQISIPLPWTPVPITGQTFAVTLMALLWGAKRGISVMLFYLLLGGLGLPIFASGSSGFVLGPTFGYLIGMLVSSLIVGRLADIGMSKIFLRSLSAAYLGSTVVFIFGILGLSFFVDQAHLLPLGVFPFLPGDTIKNVLAAIIASKSHNQLKRLSS